MQSEFKKRQLLFNEIIALISSIGIIGWIISDFFGGMILWAISLGIIILPIILFYIFSFIDTLISIIRKGKKASRIKLIAHGTVLFVIFVFNVYQSDIFKSDRVMTAILNDDLYSYTLIFRKNGKVENQANGIFGFSETYHGRYKIENDLIVFIEKPYDNDFLPDTLLIDKKQSALFLEKNKNGEFRTKKEWLNHFKILKKE